MALHRRPGTVRSRPGDQRLVASESADGGL